MVNKYMRMRVFEEGACESEAINLACGRPKLPRRNG
jgi:hypothetical protein